MVELENFANFSNAKNNRWCFFIDYLIESYEFFFMKLIDEIKNPGYWVRLFCEGIGVKRKGATPLQ
jgi:hypothetical protein